MGFFSHRPPERRQRKRADGLRSLDDKGKALLREWIESLSDEERAQMLP